MNLTTLSTAAARIEQLLTPDAVTIVGASENKAPARHLMANLFDGEQPFPGQVNLVNRSRPTLHGREAFGSTAEVPGDPGLVFLLIPSEHCLEALRGFDKLPQGVVVYASGAESGFAAVEEQLSEWSRATGVPLLGPQATGIARPAQGLVALTAPLRAAPVAGRLGVIMQSAGLLGGTLNALWQREIGVHTAVSLGNSAVLDYADLAGHLADQDDVGGLAIYVDGLSGMDPLIEIAVRAQRRDKPVVLCVGGRSDAGSAAAQSHTGALATPRRVLEGIADQYGIVLVDDTDELVWTVEAFEQMDYRRPRPGGVGIFSTSGGGAIMLADAMSAAGAELPLPGEQTRAALSRKKEVVSFNPFDVGAAALDDPAEVASALETFAGDPAFSVVVSVATVGVPTRTGMEAYVRQTTGLVDGVRAVGKQPLIAAPVAGAVGRVGPELAGWAGAVVAQGSKEASVKARSICAWGARADVSAPLPTAPARPPVSQQGEASRSQWKRGRGGACRPRCQVAAVPYRRLARRDRGSAGRAAPAAGGQGRSRPGSPGLERGSGPRPGRSRGRVTRGPLSPCALRRIRGTGGADRVQLRTHSWLPGGSTQRAPPHVRARWGRRRRPRRVPSSADDDGADGGADAPVCHRSRRDTRGGGRHRVVPGVRPRPGRRHPLPRPQPDRCGGG
jgi:succinyl-CoA synthetase alpha subunit